ncbi:hypothetical protein CK228_24495 [Mesorhizobium sp. WSM4312]|uniref:hypothetical protein n=1 Tax=unclassified Mesorhizobium TaxID=325217 RepID=UPI000BAFAA77|nr:MULTISPECIES: hypothetical protein [unclassified Mesorhizobium]PBB23960.1 hypothetical protein CK232_24625 [Mesorhizobium sp. WSM4304]PBB65912.1 hypothetical protein CK228_24495 [Mesorhizobium sp. WSM4312]PBB72879.1 hypothetical protein CK227_24740 [Mesorhizobium sp. WSM4308]PBC20094.1 hypothetical protein CK226_25355 [Mesorhizobium sp. WSM4311]TRC75261.1 hypothetical protein FJV80_28190 [Mesorhizobium sp. WSM4310]
MARIAASFVNITLCLLPGAVMLACLAACSSSNAAGQQAQTSKSAANSAIMVIDNWIAGAVPSHYAEATLRSLAQTLADLDRQLQRTDVSDSSKQLARQLTAAAGRAEDAIKSGNQGQVEQARQDFRNAVAKLVVANPADQATNP